MKFLCSRPTWAEVNLDFIKHNFCQLKNIIGNEIKVLAVVKANAYGHGIIEISRVMGKQGVDYLGVATLDEAIYLRKSRIKVPILVLGSVFPHEFEHALDYNITLTLCNQELSQILNREARKRNEKAKVHIKVDTGMGRIGVWHEEAPDFIKGLTRLKNLELEGVYTHFSSAGRDKFFTLYQIDSFEALLNKLRRSSIDIPYRHAANSIALVDFRQTHLNLVRPGIIIYGILPKKGFGRILDLKPAFSLKTKVAFLKPAPPGRSVSYGRTYIIQKNTQIATLPIGYADGYGRILSNKAQVLIRGQRAPVVGIVTMDQTMVDVGHIKGVQIGDEVVLIGKQGEDEVGAAEIARLAGTIPYEIICSISNRVPRVYKTTSK